VDSLILAAAHIAREAHRGQLRKYRPRPYIEHPARVAASAMLIEGITPDEVAAAWLHDVIEDCGYTPQRLRNEGITERAVQLVVELTIPSKQHPELSRAQRMQMDREHLRQISFEARRLKMLDRIDNLRDVAEAPGDFRSLYAAETVLLADELQDVDPVLLEDLLQAIEALGFTREHCHHH
jgi:guanosine-3',5'-bis(diphosphate) 3'-pyrophosphohydrolase